MISPEPWPSAGGWREFFDLLSDAVVVFDTHARVVLANTAALRLLPSEAGMPVEQFQATLGGAAVRRGLLMEELVRGSGDEEMRNEMFICGVFSLLDRMFQEPFSTLLETIPVPERVREALAESTGPYQPYIELVQAIEGESLFDLREGADKLMMSVSEINRAQLRALMAASELE